MVTTKILEISDFKLLDGNLSAIFTVSDLIPHSLGTLVFKLPDIGYINLKFLSTTPNKLTVQSVTKIVNVLTEKDFIDKTIDAYGPDDLIMLKED